MAIETGATTSTETEEGRRERESEELLQELRVILPGAEVLFAFLLTLPFTQRFRQVSGLQRGVYFATLLCTALATALLIAPSTHHRLQWRRHAREQRLEMANRLAIAGTTLLALASTGVIFLIADLLFGGLSAVVVAAVVGGTFAWLWYGLPLLCRLRH